MSKKVLITGMAGFIGFHLAKKLKSENFQVCGFDNFNDYYDILYKPQRDLLIFINYGIYHNGKTVKVNPIK
jgi:nucleoside-diphosphate-sugar epimerase